MATYPEIDTRVPGEVEREVIHTHSRLFPTADRYFVQQAFGWLLDCFQGRVPGFQAIDARYHDLEHTLQGTLCLARMLKGRHEAGATPAVDQRSFQLALLAILFHDTGYLKVTGDTEGTGAKYTLIHVNRSADFAAAFLRPHGFAGADLLAVQNMIRCTGVNADLGRIPFNSELERVLGFALASADLLGQMAALDYVDKLPILFSEFEECAIFNSGRMSGTGHFLDAQDLMRKTPGFWSRFVIPKLENDFQGIYHHLRIPFPDGPNPYVIRIEANLRTLAERIATTPEGGVSSATP